MQSKASRNHFFVDDREGFKSVTPAKVIARRESELALDCKAAPVHRLHRRVKIDRGRRANRRVIPRLASASLCEDRCSVQLVYRIPVYGGVHYDVH